jgi:hypothetical protein
MNSKRFKLKKYKDSLNIRGYLFRNKHLRPIGAV